MRIVNILSIFAVTIFAMPFVAFAEGDHDLKEACKVECPSATTEHEAHKCMKDVVKAKKADKKFRKSDCYAALREHEKHEEQEGHKH
jgi:hypothetical protein